MSIPTPFFPSTESMGTSEQEYASQLAALRELASLADLPPTERKVAQLAYDVQAQQSPLPTTEAAVGPFSALMQSLEQVQASLSEVDINLESALEDMPNDQHILQPDPEDAKQAQHDYMRYWFLENLHFPYPPSDELAKMVLIGIPSAERSALTLPRDELQERMKRVNQLFTNLRCRSGYTDWVDNYCNHMRLSGDGKKRRIQRMLAVLQRIERRIESYETVMENRSANGVVKILPRPLGPDDIHAQDLQEITRMLQDLDRLGPEIKKKTMKARDTHASLRDPIMCINKFRQMVYQASVIDEEKVRPFMRLVWELKYAQDGIEGLTPLLSTGPREHFRLSLSSQVTRSAPSLGTFASPIFFFLNFSVVWNSHLPRRSKSLGVHTQLAHTCQGNARTAKADRSPVPGLPFSTCSVALCIANLLGRMHLSSPGYSTGQDWSKDNEEESLMEVLSDKSGDDRDSDEARDQEDGYQPYRPIKKQRRGAVSL